LTTLSPSSALIGTKQPVKYDLAIQRLSDLRDLARRQEEITRLLAPLVEQLGRYDEGVRRLEVERQRAYTALTEQMRHLTGSHERLERETRNLVTALRSPQTRGRWGELQLRRVVEMAGMLERCDFSEQVTSEGDAGRMRPDMVVHLPGGKNVAVDAKVPLQAFLDANEADDEGVRRAHLAAHGRQMKAHVDALAKKEYWKRVDPSPEFVVAFIPGDPLLTAALEHEPGLMEYAVANHVLLATPTFLQIYMRGVPSGDFGSLQLIVTGAEKLPERLATVFAERFGIRPLEGYGCTECGPIWDDWMQSPISCKSDRLQVSRPRLAVTLASASSR